jgi:catalase
MTTPEQMIETITAENGRHPGRRALHAKGTFTRGRFTATPAARELTRAGHMQGEPVDVLLRFSTGVGDPTVPDSTPAVRGMGASFSLPDGTVTDVACQSAPRFPVRTPEAFEALLKANTHHRARAWKLPLFLARNPSAIPTLRPNLESLKPPVGYTTLPYFGVHAFRWLDAAGGSRFVRYTFLPEGGDQRLSADDAKQRGADYLEEELVERLRTGPARLTYQAQIAQDGDPADDPFTQWPDDRDRVDVGTLEVLEVVPDPEGGDHIHVFDPNRVTDGIEPSDDPILAFRREAYSVSANRRLADQRAK